MKIVTKLQNMDCDTILNKYALTLIIIVGIATGTIRFNKL